MLEFAYPWLFLLLPLPVFLWWLAAPYRMQASAIRVPFFDSVINAAGVEARSGSIVKARSAMQTGVLIIVWLSLVTAAAKPELLGDPVTRTEAARDVMLALDLSGSMDTVDFGNESEQLIGRLDAVKRVIDEFVAERTDDRIGLIVFGNKAYVQLPFTRDLTTARELVALTEVGMAGPKTAIGDAIGLSIRQFEHSETKERLLILLTDGNDTSSRMTPINAADIAADRDVEIFTIGVGDPDADGEDRVDFDVLQQIAKRTGGRFFTADDMEGLRSVYARIDQMVPAEAKTQTWRPHYSMVHWPLGVAFLLTCISFVMREAKR